VLALPGTAEPSAPRARALAEAGNLASLQGTLSEAEALLHEALTTAGQTGGAFEQARCWHFLGNVARRRGALNEATVLYERAIALARSAGIAGIQARATSLVAAVRYELDDAEGLRTALAAAGQLPETEADPRLHAFAFTLESWLATLDGDNRSGLAFLEQGLAVADAVGDRETLEFAHRVAAAERTGPRQSAGRCEASGDCSHDRP
jgi:tetratricopeptide (TPR) repeat protein